MKPWTAARPWLTSFVPLYRLGQVLVEGRKTVRRLGWPVVSIGNLSTGGAGKTPLTIALAAALIQRGVHVDVLSRGYGRTGTGAEQVRKDGSAERFGDEPIEIARATGVSVYVAAERYEAGLLAERDGAGAARAVHLLDDGFQHRQLHRDVDILLVHPRDLYDWLLPAGNLREALQAAVRADVVAIPADEPEFETRLLGFLEKRGWRGELWRLRRRMEVPPVAGLAVAFCGIARPEQFFAGLEADGVRIARRFVFADHHRYTERDVARLAAAAGDGVLLTTEKDAVRLGPLAAKLPLRTVALRTEIEDEEAALEWILGRLRLVE